jgi:hypothetical protein
MEMILNVTNPVRIVWQRHIHRDAGSFHRLLLSKHFVISALSIFFIFIAFAGFSHSAGANLRKGPYLLFAPIAGTKSVDTTAMTVLWQTDSTPGSATIRWGASTSSYGAPVSVTESGPGQDEHQFSHIIRGLNSGTKYYYEITVDSTSASGTFKTPPDTTATSLTFYGYGDIRGQEWPSDTTYEQHSLMEALIMSDVSQDAATRQTLLINASDFVNCGMDEFYWDHQYFNRALTGSMQFMANLPLVAPVGNHERYWAGIKDQNDQSVCNKVSYPYTGMTSSNACHVIESTDPGLLFYKYFPYAFFDRPKGPGEYKNYYYHADYGPARFLMLDTFFAGYAPGTSQYTWLSDNMRSSTRWNIPVFHAPMWATWYPIDGVLAGNLRKAWSPVFEANYVPLVIQGHEHFYSRLLVNGITYLTLGGGGASLNAVTSPEAVSENYVMSTHSKYHYGRFEVSGDTMIVTIIDNSGNTIDSFKILPPTTHISPVNNQTTPTCTPTLRSSPFVSQDGTTHQGSQWIVRDATNNSIAYITHSIDARGNVYSRFDTQNLTSFTLPRGSLECSHHYQWQVVYKDSNGNTTQASTVTPFYTPTQAAGTNDYGIPVTANQVNDQSHTPIDVITSTNVAALQADATFRAAVPSIDSVAALITAGSITDSSGNSIPINPAGFSLVKTQGGMGQPIAVVIGGTDTMVSIMPINNAGNTISNNSGNMTQAATFAIPSGGNLPYGIFDFIANVTEGSTAKIVFVPPVPFAPGTKWYKLDPVAGALIEYSHFEVNAQGNGILTLADNGLGDTDWTWGVIRDPGGPLVSSPTGADDSARGSSSGCFIATAAFGSYLHPFVRILSSFRDTFLNTNASGRSFVAWYYKISPPIADMIRTHEAAKAAVRILLILPIGFSALCLKMGLVPAALIVLLCGVPIVIGIRRLLHLHQTWSMQSTL